MSRPRAERPTYSLTKRGERYYVQWWEDNTARRISCRTGQLAAARRFLAEFEAGRSVEPVPIAPTIGQVLDGYRAEREREPCSPTLGYNIAHLKAAFADLPSNLFAKQHARSYVSKRRRAGLGGAAQRKTQRPPADSTLRRELLTLRAAFVWAEKEGWLAKAPQVEAPQPGQARDRWLTREEADRLLASTKQVHVKVFVALALYTAGRAGALLSLTWSQIDFGAGIVDLGKGSGNKRRATVPMVPALRPILEMAYRDRTTIYVVEHGGARVGSIKTGFRNAAARADLQGVTPHTLRHTAATWMAQRGVSLDKIAAYLGNTAVTVERVYAHHHPDHMADAAAAFGPVS